MNKALAMCALAAAVAASGAARAEVPVVKTEDAELNVGGMIQVLGFGQKLDDPYKNDARTYLFMKAGRLRVSGRYDQVSFYSELALGGEDAIAATTGVSLGLLDFYFNIPLFSSKTTYVKVGQFKVPYGREGLTYDAYTQFGDTSIDYAGFKVGRDVGLAIVSKPGPMTLIAGVFTGGGRDVPPQHYLPEKIGVPMLVARVGIGDVDDDPFILHADGAESKGISQMKGAFFVNALYTKDSLVGHSTVLNVKLIDKSLLIDSNWNPYIAQAPFDQGTLAQVGADAAVRVPMGAATLAGEAEFNWGKYANKFGSVEMSGLRAQGGVLFDDFLVGARYVLLRPDGQFNYKGTQVTGGQPIHEFTPGATWFLKGERLKIVAELPILFQAPVFTEKNVGAYVGTELPGETSVLANGGTSTRQNIVEGRLMLQAQF
ncbi:MAG: hypothetical protein JST92_24685 [Deltaproteobacteria bacterium]|nr:hypothetical protein [Deltaproteobacteria bacterium]